MEVNGKSIHIISIRRPRESGYSQLALGLNNIPSSILHCARGVYTI